jgi:hypothetical protein
MVEDLLRPTFVDDPYFVLILLPKKKPEALRFFAEAPFGERITKEHKFSHLNRRDGVMSTACLISQFPLSALQYVVPRLSE